MGSSHLVKFMSFDTVYAKGGNIATPVVDRPLIRNRAVVAFAKSSVDAICL